jgi:hypothetical protein
MVNIASFRTTSSSIPFVISCDEHGFATVPESLLCLRFNLQQQSLLVEKEEFDSDGVLNHTIY